MTNPYQYWQDAIAGKKPKAIVDQCELGFYRKGQYQRDVKGINRRVGWIPVAVFMSGNTMTARVGDRDVTGDALGELWSYIAANPISEEEWRQVAENNQRWTDDPAPPEDALERIIGPNDNKPPDVITAQDHAAAIDNAIGAAPKAVKSEEEAAQALGMKNRLAELRLACDKAGKAEYEPLYANYVKVRDPWQKPVKRAADEEKRLNTIILQFREVERQRIAKEQAAADAIKREFEDRTAEVIEIAPVAAPAPIAPTYGTRKIKEELHTILDAVTDYDAVYAFLKAEPKVKALLLELATAKVKAGFTVPGTTIRQGLI